MTDKERLEEIKLKFSNTIDIMLYVPYEDVKFLIEQAERAQELESELNKQIEIGYKFEGEVYDLAKENKRYREAIERALGESGWGDEGNALYRTIGILTKTLEGEE